MLPRPKLLLFDLDGVLVRYERTLRCRQLAAAIGADEDEVTQALFGRNGLELRSDKGEIDLPQYLDLLREQYGWNVTDDDFLGARRASTRTDPAMLSLCEALAPQAALAIFTNNGAWFCDAARRIVPELSPLFGRRLVCSGSLGLLKPAPEAFVACLQRLGFNAMSTLLVDDREENVAGALAAGLEAVHFEGVDTLRQALRAFDFDLDLGEDDAA
jgi:HAD superfamily hydrolase (TIGR01509 family)